jgi:hypothetical protein
MQFFKSTILLALAFATFAVAAPAEDTEAGYTPHKPCKPLLQSCAVNSECCGDLCVAGVSTINYRTELYELTDPVISQLCI